MNRGLSTISKTELLQLCGTLQMGQIKPEEMRRLQAALRREEQAVQIYVEYVAQSVSLKRIIGETLLADPQSAAELLHRFFFERERRREIFARSFLICIVAASLLLTIFGGYQLSVFLNSEPSPRMIGLIHRQVPLSTDARFQVGRRIHSSEQIHLEQGVTQFRLSNGVLLNVQSPALLTFDSSKQVTLHFGMAEVTVPPEAVGFTLTTPTGRFIDLGTRFGVAVTSEGDSECAVMEGLAEVRIRTKNWTEFLSKPLRLPAGHAVEVSENKITSCDFNAVEGRLNRINWGLQGVISHSQNLTLMKVSPTILKEQFGPLLLLESEAVPLRQGDLVNHFQSGESVPAESDPPMILLDPSGTVNSFWFCVHTPFKEADRQIAGVVEVQFATPILGVISSTQTIQESQQRFASPEMEYHWLTPEHHGGMEYNDSIQISEDRRTLRLKYSAEVDQCRILVQTPE